MAKDDSDAESKRMAKQFAELRARNAFMRSEIKFADSLLEMTYDHKKKVRGHTVSFK